MRCRHSILWARSRWRALRETFKGLLYGAVLQVHMREMSPEGEEVIRVGKLYLVDLAGSENVNRWLFLALL